MVLCISPLSFKGGSWGKLQSEHSKPHWIKIDFDHFEVSDSEDENGVSYTTPLCATLINICVIRK